MNTAAPPDRLLFVYNADGGIFAALGDAIHKIASPTTYPCSLCAITYGAVSMKPAWKAFLKHLPFEAHFHHRDDFALAWPEINIALPAILIVRQGQTPELLVDAPTLDRQTDVGSLIETLRAKLAERAA